MPLTIDSFQGKINSLGLTKPNKYEVVILPPTTVSTDTEEISIMCDTVSIAGKSITRAPRRVYGIKREMPYSGLFTEFNMSFYSTEKMQERKFFDKWMELVFPTQKTIGANYDIEYYDNFVGTIQVYTLNDKLERKSGIEYVEAWPYNMSAVDLAYASNNQLAKITVGIQYAYWVDIFAQRTIRTNVQNRIQQEFIESGRREEVFLQQGQSGPS